MKLENFEWSTKMVEDISDSSNHTSLDLIIIGIFFSLMEAYLEWSIYPLNKFVPFLFLQILVTILTARRFDTRLTDENWPSFLDQSFSWFIGRVIAFSNIKCIEGMILFDNIIIHPHFWAVGSSDTIRSNETAMKSLTQKCKQKWHCENQYLGCAR